MKINLRKASALQGQIRGAIAERSALVNGAFSVPLWNVNDEQLARERSAQMAALNAAERLEDILSDIRTQVGKANVKSRISALLAEQVRVASQIARYTRLAKSAEVMPSSNDLERRAAALTEMNAKSSYHNEQSFSVGVFSQPDLDKFKTALVKLRRRQVEINDELIAQNLSNEVAISDNDWAWLEVQGIV